jgi:hypothetical protein
VADDKLARLGQLRASLAYFGSECLKIRDKSGDIEPLTFNAAQLFVHEALERQKAEKGWVRALILKGRQQGISTYTAARFYHSAAMRRGVNVYILAHEQTASDTLFGIVDRYQRNSPIAPHIGVANAKELVFDKLDSSYAVATAGTKAGGRSKAISLFHGSEVAFWTNAADHFAASVQGVPLAPGTEVILESTSAGFGGEFHSRWLEAEAGNGDYIPIFLPWWLQTEYARVPEPGFKLAQEADEEGQLCEQEYADTYKLSLPQMAWRRGKIFEIRSSRTFRREYPATPMEAWVENDGGEPFISGINVVRALRRWQDAPNDKGSGPLILGVDPASMGGDNFAVAARRGMRVLWVKCRNRIDTIEGTAWIRSLIDELNPARVNIDVGNVGAAIVTNLKSLAPKYVEVVRGVDFGSKSQSKNARPDAPGPKLRRDEMWMRMRDWLDLPEGAAIPPDDKNNLQTDLASVRAVPLLTNDVKLESKEQLRKRIRRSPDRGDAVALTFASREFFQNFQDAPRTTSFGQIDALHDDVVTQFGDLPPAGAHGWMA